MEMKEPSAKYQVRPGYKQTEMGLLPEDWEIVPLSALCRSICDGTHFTPRYVSQGVPFYSVENVTANEFENTKFISEAEHAILVRRCKPERGDILMTRIGSIGDTRLLDWEVNASIYVSLALLKPGNRVDAKYLYRYSKSKTFVLDAEKRSLLNATPKKINMGDIGAIPIPVPSSLSEQEAIAEALSDTDALIESLAELLAKKRQIKQGAMQELLTGKKRLPGFSGEWVVKQLGELAVLSKSGINPAAHPNNFFTHFSLPAFDADATPVVEQGNCIGSNKFVVPARAVLLSKLNPRIPRIWAPSDIPNNAVCSTEFLVLIPKDGINRDYFAALCRSPMTCSQMELHATGTTGSHQRMNPSQALAIELPVPQDPTEQAAIADFFADTDAELDALEGKLAKARILKQGMMQELLTGRIRLV